MAIEIKFDSAKNPIPPTLVLSTRSGGKIGVIPAYNIVLRDGINIPSELSFRVSKKECEQKQDLLWEQIVDFKLLWVKEWNIWFEIYVSTSESNDIVKNITAKSLAQAELSEIVLYDVEINTENDISRDDYEATTIYNALNPNASLLNRILEKAPHYSIAHVDSTVADIQRTFTFDNKSIFDAMREVAESINCLFIFDNGSNPDGSIKRSISVYNLASYCLDCGEEDIIGDVCPNCGSANITTGYGVDTTIFVSSDNLGNEITLETDNSAVKDCFRLIGGDDLMTATIRNCNPNGSGYLWYIPDFFKRDMSMDLANKLNDYNELYDYYENTYSVDFQDKTSFPSDGNNDGEDDGEVDIGFGDEDNLDDEGREDGTGEVEIEIDIPWTVAQYNALIQKYLIYNPNLKEIILPVVGYASIMENYYNIIDTYYFLNNSLMPSVETADTDAAMELAKLTYSSLSPVAVQDLATCSTSTASSYVLAMAKLIIDSRYQVKIIADKSTFTQNTWSGVFTVTNFYNSEDTATSEMVNVRLTDDYEEFVNQSLKRALGNAANNGASTDIIGLFALSTNDFINELQKYSLQRLNAFRDACQSCLDILVQQGAGQSSSDLYESIYLSYYDKLGFIQSEILIRESEIQLVMGKTDDEGDFVKRGAYSIFLQEKDKINAALNFENYLGTDLWLEFATYRREGEYQNDSYISDGLDNSALFNMALEFMKLAKKEIYKSAMLQHSINVTLKNLLVIKEFEPLVNNFRAGNYIRVRSDNSIYRLQLLTYEINFDNLDNINVMFSDLVQVHNRETEVIAVLNRAANMVNSYGTILRQNRKIYQNYNAVAQLSDDFATVSKFITNTNTQTNNKSETIQSANNQNVIWDNNGILGREYSPNLSTYDDKQWRLMGKNLFVTNDGWLSSNARIGNFSYWNRTEGHYDNVYGVLADTLVRDLILDGSIGIYNNKDNFVIDNNGLSISTTDNNGNVMTFTVNKGTTNLVYIDTNGNLVLDNSIKINNSGTIVSLADYINSITNII